MTYTAINARGETISYSDAKRHLFFFSMFTPLVPMLSIGLYFLSGGALAATLIPLVFVFGMIPIADAWLGEDFDNPPAEVLPAMEADSYYRNLAIATVPLYWASFLATTIFVGTQSLPWWSIVALILGVGTVNGGCIALGHELGHKQNRVDQIFGMLANNVVGYAHFRVEHNRGHHTWVATPEDPASSRYGEFDLSLRAAGIAGRFRARLAQRGGAPGQARPSRVVAAQRNFAGFRARARRRLRADGNAGMAGSAVHSRASFHRLVRADAGQLCRALWAAAPKTAERPLSARRAAPFVEHQPHLLEPADVPPAAPFRPPRQSDEALSGAAGLQGLPRLPSGYPGMYLLAAIPPLWFRVMNPKVMAWAGGDIGKVNATPEARASATYGSHEARA